jgi:hypothetical protein
MRGQVPKTLFVLLAVALVALPLAAAAPAKEVTARDVWSKAAAAAARHDGRTLVHVTALETGATAGDGRDDRWTFTYITARDRSGLQETVKVTVDARGRLSILRDAGATDHTVDVGRPALDTTDAVRELRMAPGFSSAVQGQRNLELTLAGWPGVGPVWVAAVVDGAGTRTFWGVQAETGRLVDPDLARHAWRGAVEAESGRTTYTMLAESAWMGQFQVAWDDHALLHVHFEGRSVLDRLPNDLLKVTFIAPDGQMFVDQETKAEAQEGVWTLDVRLPPLAGAWDVLVETATSPAGQVLTVQEVALDWCASGAPSRDRAVALSQFQNPACRGIVA